MEITGFDASAPNVARYDYFLRGKDNFAADRQQAERLLAIYPPLRDLARENKAFLAQATTWAARQGIGQFFDLGAGLPAAPAIHEVARAVNPAAKAAYVDIDPVVISQVAAGYARLMAPKSCLIISVACCDDEVLAKQLAAEYTAATWHNHSRADIVSFFAGLDLVGPGITEAQTWRAWMPEPVLRRRDGHVLAGVARRA